MPRRLAASAAWIRDFGWNPRKGGRGGVIAVLGGTQWIAWGSTYYLVTVIAKPVAADTGWSLATVIAGLSLGLVIAGLVSPTIGKLIERRGGSPVLSAGALLVAIGLVALALAHSRVGYFAAWAVLGVGMGASLYDAAFAALGRLYGLGARVMISNLTLVGGLAMTVTWPLSAALTQTIGWRDTCLVYAALQFFLCLPLLSLLLPSQAPEARAGAAVPRDITPTPRNAAAPARSPAARRILLVLLGGNLTLQIGIGAVLAVHLLTLLQGLGLDLAGAVALGSVMGACQVGARLIEIALARYVHPVWEGVVASMLVLLGIALLLTRQPAMIAVAIVIYGFGNGVRTIVKGTLPLVLFGAEGYATLIGRLGMPTLIAQAAGPAAGALLLARYGTVATLGLLSVLALLNLVLSWSLRLGLRRSEPNTLEAPSAVPR
jgi:MFS family permease